ncbi:MAG: DUF748 domain-containing protein [Bacteroidia bacterium]|nr:DUF748 domain-containing protein [Bacteroidia bacterium]
MTQSTFPVKKIILITVSILLLIAGLVILFISPITKYLIEKYDEKYTGREITLDWAYVNPFTGYIHFSNLEIKEFKSDTTFLSLKGLSVNLSVRKLFSKEYEINEIILDHPKVIISQNKKVMNFDDIIKKFAKDTTELPDTNKAPVHFKLEKITLAEGEFHYLEKSIPVNYFIKNVNIENKGLQWDSDTTTTKFSFISGMGSGDVKGIITINTKNMDYSMASVVHNFDLKIIEQYLKAITNYGTFRAHLDADIKAKGNFKDQENITASGSMAVSDFHFGKNIKEDYASFDKLALAIYELSPKFHKYSIDSISLTHPYFKYERYDKLDNIQTMFGKNGANVKEASNNSEKFNLVIELAKYVKVLAKNFFKSDFKVNRIAVYNGHLKYYDYALSEKFWLGTSSLYIFADSINKNKKRVDLILRTGLKPFGDVSASISMDPKNNENFDLNYHLEKVPVPMFNPYLITYTSFPADRGNIEVKGNWHVALGQIKSDNHLIVIDPRLTKRLKKRGYQWIPLRLVMFFVRERGNVIDYQIPITGNLNDPKFNLWDVITDILKNIFVKPASSPYILEVKTVEKEIEKSLTFSWETRQIILRNQQKKFLDKMEDFLKDNPEASITVHPIHFTEKEKEYILFFEAKKKYFIRTHPKDGGLFNEDDSTAVEKLTIKDDAFINYLNKHNKDSMLFTIQDKCKRFVDPNLINAKYQQLNKARADLFLSYFKENKADERVKFVRSKSITPINGFSFYKIDYEGKMPEALNKAYNQMNELNEDDPRKEYKGLRKKIKGLFTH